VDDLATRAEVSSLFPGIVLLACGISLMKDTPSRCRFSRWFTGAMFAFGGASSKDPCARWHLQSGYNHTAQGK